MKPLPLAIAALLLAAIAWRRRGLGTERLLIGLALAAASGVYGSGVIEIPNLEQAIKDVGRTLGAWTYLLVAALAFLETGAFVGLIAPGEFTIIFGGVVAGQGEIDVFLLIGIVWASAVAGDSLSFLLGRRLGRAFMVRHGPRVKITEERLAHVERFFARHGGKTILIGRFVGLVRAVAPFIAGASRMPFGRFIPYDVIGAGLWGTTFVTLGYIFWHSFDRVASIASKGAFALGTVIALVVGAIVAYRWLRVAGNRSKARAWLHTQAERPVLRPLAGVLRPLVRRVALPLYRRVEPPLRFAWKRVTPGELGLELTTLLAVASVGSFVFISLAIRLGGNRFTEGDLRTLDLVDKLRSDAAVDAARLVTTLGSTEVVGAVVLLTAVYLAIRRHVAEAVALVSASVLTVIAVNVAKAAVDRPRPTHRLIEVGGESYPSGHAAYAVALVAVAVALRHALPWLVGRFAVVGIAVTVAAAVGATRLYLRAHFLSDVIGGFGLAAAIFASCGIVALVASHLRDNAR